MNMSPLSFMSVLGVLLFFSAFCIQGSLQQCVQNQTYNIVPAYNIKIDAPNVLRLAVIGSLIGNTSEFASNIVRFAAERINNDSTLLPDTRIELVFLPNTAIDLSSNLLLTLFAIQDLKVHGIIGGLSTTESRVIQLAAKLYNVPQLSSHGVGAVLANKEEYPYYACIQPFDTIQISAIIAQFDYFKWTRGVILYSDNDYGAGYTGLVSQGAHLGIQFVSFSISSSATSTAAIADQMNIIKNQIINDRYRIIVLYLTAQSTAYVMSLAHELGLVNDQFVYILSTNAAGVYTQRLQPDVLPYLKGSLGVILPVPAGPFYQTEFDAYKEVQAQNPTKYIAFSPRNQFFWSIYDTVLAYAHAVDTILKDGTPFGNMKGAQLYQQILKTTFYGTTGDLAFTPKGDRLGFYSITNFQNNLSVEVAQYSSRTNNISTNGAREFIFYGGTNAIPSDGTVTSRDGYICKTVDGAVICERDYILREYSKGLAGGLGAIIGVGVLVALFAIVMLVLHWKIYISKYGTFYCAVILTGVLTSYVAAFSLLPDPTDALCVVFPWFLGIAFTLVYGCLFIKAWILYRLWRYALQLKRMSITALTVVKYVGAALCVEIILLIVWTVVDPPRVRLIKMVDHSLQPQCQSDTPIFWTIFLCLKGVWLLFGVVVSVLTRTVVKEYQNFTEFTYAMYNILIMVIIAVPLGLLLEEVPNGVLIVSVVVIVLAFLFSTVILFFNIWYSLLYSDKLSISSNLSAHKSSPSQSKISGGSSSSRSHV